MRFSVSPDAWFVVLDLSTITNQASGETEKRTASELKNYIAPFLACRVTQSAGQSITASTLTALAFNTEAYDTDTLHDTVTNNSRINFNSTGYYRVTGVVSTDANAAVWGGIRLNGSTYIYKLGAGNAGASTANGIQVAFTYLFTAADYIELMGAFGTTQNTKSGFDGCFLSVEKIA